MKTKGNDSAFCKTKLVNYDYEKNGLTKREYFAAVAMQGLLASSPQDVSVKCISELSVQCADDLIRQLNESDTSSI